MNNDLLSREDSFETKFHINEQVSGSICAKHEVSNCFSDDSQIYKDSNVLGLTLVKALGKQCDVALYFVEDIYITDTRTVVDQCDLSKKAFDTLICKFFCKVIESCIDKP